MNKPSMKTIINRLNKKGFTNSYIERVLGLSFGSLTRWRSGSYSPEKLALMRLIDCFPWFLSVADEKFDEKYSQRKLVVEGLITLFDLEDKILSEKGEK